MNENKILSAVESCSYEILLALYSVEELINLAARYQQHPDACKQLELAEQSIENIVNKIRVARIQLETNIK